MTRRFLIHALAAIYIAVETTGIGMKARSVPMVQFLSWQDAVEYFLSIGATQEALDAAKASLDKSGNAQLLVTPITP